MEPIEVTPKPVPSETGALSFFPKMHLVVAGALVSALVAMTTMPADKNTSQRYSLALPDLEQSFSSESFSEPLEAPLSWAELETDAPKTRQEELVVKSGDSLSTLFQRAGLSDKDMYELVNSRSEGKRLAKLYPGHRLVFTFGEDKKLISLTRHFDALNSEVFTAQQTGGYEYTKIEKKPEIKVAVRTGIIQSSLYKAGLDAGLNEDLIMSFAGIFGWDIDFALDIRKGDSFRILYEEKFFEGERLGTGAILAAEFVNQGTAYQAVRYVNREGEVQYYSPTGKAMRKAFLRAPVDFRRISSNFNPRRLHPITKTVRPHRGTDYAADRGTPVWASGDGKVITSGYTEANGNYVVIQHGADIQTKYLHLHKRNVKAGERVRQGQVIGVVGSTGYSTAPHLHYEFLLNGVHRDPRTIVQQLPKSVSVPSNELERFYAQTQPLIVQLNQVTNVASLDSDSKKL
ncbi:peptidase M23 [Saccharophagus sp. K07]|nr:peptidoglycan DD-metalloendopeptidase family protein [Saccharophagus sp. K07]MBC6905380.1 peptidase M23 [Saccharophagus sp. K07]